jgi:hypothetical protein
MSKNPDQPEPKRDEKIKQNTSGGDLKARAFGEAADAFGKEVAPLGPRAGELAFRVGNLLLDVLEGTVYGVEQVSAWLREAIATRLKGIPEERINKPNPRIAVPAVQALVYSMEEEHIREMFANLLAANMTERKENRAHPAFVEMIKQMTPMDAEVLAVVSRRAQVKYRVLLVRSDKWNDIGGHFSFQAPLDRLTECKRSINNLQRLGVLEIRDQEWPIVPEDSIRVTEIEALYKTLPVSIGVFPSDQFLEKSESAQLKIVRQGIFLTTLGEDFVRFCRPQSLPTTILNQVAYPPPSVF